MAESLELQNTLAALMANTQKMSEDSKANMQKLSDENKANMQNSQKK